MRQVTLKIKGMTCSACANGLQKFLNKQKGVLNATVNLVLASADITYDETIDIDTLNKYIMKGGYESLGKLDLKKEEQKNNRNLYILICFGIYSIFYFYISMGHMFNLWIPEIINMDINPLYYGWTLFILTIPYLIYGFSILKGGVKNLFHLTPNMDTLIILGVFTSFIYSIYNLVMISNGNIDYVHNLYFESCAFIIFFVKLGRYIENMSKEKTKEAIKKLVSITPEEAILIKNGKEKKVTIDEVKKGDTLKVIPGSKFAVDGVIIEGNGYIDETFLTGESVYKKKTKGDKVYAGAINIDRVIYYEALDIGSKSSISEMVRLVSLASNTKPKIAHIADVFSGYFVYFIIIIALLSLGIHLLLGSTVALAVKTFVTILVVACPCALGLATPLAVVVSTGVCAKEGILIRSSEVFERALKIDTIIFDKTGTLTSGKLCIYKVFNYSDYPDAKLIQMVASLEVNSSHPISKAFLGEENLLDVKDFIIAPGSGIEGVINNNKVYAGNRKYLEKLKIENKYLNDEEDLSKNGASIIYVIEENQVLGLIGIKDVIRDNAADVVDILKKNYEIIMLSGDNEITAKMVAKNLGINKVYADISPMEKHKIINSLVNDNKHVLMVGDGINDAPSLALADIGISISNATDIAKSSSDVILVHDNLMDIVNFLNISKKTIKNIKENLFWAFIYNLLMIPIATGLFANIGLSISPMVASIAMIMSSITVILNASRLNKMKGEK